MWSRPACSCDVMKTVAHVNDELVMKFVKRMTLLNKINDTGDTATQWY